MSLPEPFGTIERAIAAVSGWRMDRRIRRALARAKPTNVAALEEGVMAKIRGHVKPDEYTHEAPLSGRPCVYWAIECAEIGEVGVHDILFESTMRAPFLLVDAGHRAKVDPGHSQIGAAYDFESFCLSGTDADPRQRALLAEHHHEHHRAVQGRQLRFREAAICIDQAIAVLGSGVRESDPGGTAEGAYREMPTRLHISGTAKLPLVISDDPRAWSS